MRNALLIIILASTVAACAAARSAERLDRQGQRQGRHLAYYDDARTQLLTRGRYRHGRPVGRWRYYALAGELQRQERYRRHGFSDIAYYYPGGQVARQGRARVVDEPSGAHFFWLGEWQHYSPAGTLDSVQLYELGKHVSTRYPIKKQ
ncbi:hypothetical protein QMK33_14835 [Hymenobacter sp. H14-R3]|uniref:toxin-antitoxin system YwqK family antitoxin n=1 Tax=Hymenobacter sp. H14-R3 TaxID=3046308 RepID=UPI0024BB7CB9|nr:hypothetical protein [Hymenobacter sp. H14-R3]MDJ0366432.1 hypothetical protein [Hymenobacter sp. H14-R3]